MEKRTLSYYIVILFALFSLSCNKTRPTKKCTTFTEMKDPNIDLSSDWDEIGSKLQASFVSIDNKYQKSIVPHIDNKYQNKVIGWKGEVVSAQILVWSSSDVSQLELEFSDFKSKSSRLDNDVAQARFVRYVMTDEFIKERPCSVRKPEDSKSSLAPDMLDNIDCIDLEQNTVRPVWITISIPREAEPGIYAGTISLFAQGKRAQKFTLEVEVLDQELPLVSDWSFHLDLWQHPSAVSRVHGLEVWSDAHFEKMKPIMMMLADMGQKVITANINKDPWNNQCFDAYEDMIVWTKKTDGSWHYDYNHFDKWVQFMLDLGVNKMINCYSMVPWNNELHYKDEKSDSFINVKADPGSKEFHELWSNFLPDFVSHLKEKGWLDITNIAMDERSPKDMILTIEAVEKYAPEIGVALADSHKSYERYPTIKDICIAFESSLMVESADKERRRNDGLITTFYTYCANEFPNQFTFSDSGESAFIGWYAEAADFDGFLRWAYNSWVENPLTDSRFRQWSAGDTYIVYPDGRSSIRRERLLEGIQDYEKIQIVKKQLTDNGDMANLEKLNVATSKLRISKRSDNWNIDMNNAKQLLIELSKK